MAALNEKTDREKVRELNAKIIQQLKRVGIINHKGKYVKGLDSMPDSDWKSWMYDLISARDYLAEKRRQRKRLNKSHEASRRLRD